VIKSITLHWNHRLYAYTRKRVRGFITFCRSGIFEICGDFVPGDKIKLRASTRKVKGWRFFEFTLHEPTRSGQVQLNYLQARMVKRRFGDRRGLWMKVENI
jgi:hypothetical protein